MKTLSPSPSAWEHCGASLPGWKASEGVSMRAGAVCSAGRGEGREETGS